MPELDEMEYVADRILPAELEQLIRDKNWKKLATRQSDWPEISLVAPEVYDIMFELEPHEGVLLFRALPRDLAAEVFASLDRETRDQLLLMLTDNETEQLLGDMEPDDRTFLLGELPGQVTQRLLNLLSPEDLREARKLLGYPERSIGRLMRPDYVAVRPHWTVARAIEQLRKRGREDETSNMIFVVDDDWRLLDDIPLRRFILADPEALVEDIMDGQFVTLSAYEGQEEAVQKMQRYDVTAISVVDSDGVLIGLVTIDDVLDVAREEATEDFHRTSAITPVREGYWQAGVALLYRSRIVWLAALVLVNLLSSGVIAAYEDMLLQYVALAFFMPLLIDTGGNAGSQSATIMIRAISLGEVRMGQWWRAFIKEAGLGVLIGGSLGLMGMLLGWVRGGFSIGLVVGLTMLVMLLFTNLIGVLLPFILIRMNRDPAIASGPLITSVADAVGLLIYFWIASLILGMPTA
ncbi:MAG TPA: magnesium transporter [Deinococcales bacterium]|nr:magnesium transporter [Deinococcales bacterium]